MAGARRPVLSSANAKGHGASPCPTTFNPSYVEVAGENKVGGIIVRTDKCNATNGHLSWAPCDVMTGVCGDLNASYQYNPSQGSEDPRIIYNKYDQYFCKSSLLDAVLPPPSTHTSWRSAFRQTDCAEGRP